jgi:putative nucleotidyltransferase with HDIG domain
MAGAIVLVTRRESILRRVTALSGLPQGAWGYWLLMEAAAAGVFVALGPALASTHTGWWRFAALTTAAALAQLTSVQLTRNRVFHPAIVFVVAGALLLTPQQVALMCVIQHIPDWLKHRYTWYIPPFNIANYVLAATAAAYAAAAVGAHSSAPGFAVAGVTAVVVFLVVNRTTLAPMLQLARGLKLRASGLFSFDDLTLEVVLALIAVPFSALYGRSVVLAALSLTPLALIQITQRTMHELERASGTIQEKNTQLAETNELLMERSTASLAALSATVDARDEYTAGHSRRVRDLAVAVGRELGLGESELEHLSQAGLLHDIGKIGVPDSVLLKDGPLNDAEWRLMRAHSEEGARIVERLGHLHEVVPAIRHHHERLDGRGYPEGLVGDEIPLAARIIHVADALDAMVTRRLYRAARTLAEAREELRAGRGSDFCPSCVDAFERVVTHGETSFTTTGETSFATAGETFFATIGETSFVTAGEASFVTAGETSFVTAGAAAAR